MLFRHACMQSRAWAEAQGKNSSNRRLLFAAATCTLLLLSCILLLYEGCNLLHTQAFAPSSNSAGGLSAVQAHPLTPATLVTAYYPLVKNSKRSLDDYRTWMANFLPHAKAPLVIYLPPDQKLETTVRTLRGDLPLVVRVSNMYHVLNYADLHLRSSMYTFAM